MNLYQTLNREYREFRLKQSLKENEDPTVDAIADTLSESKESEEDELARRLVSLSDALNTATDEDEIKAIQEEINEIKSKLDSIDGDNINDSENTDECDSKEIKEAGANLDISAGVDIPDNLATAAGMALLASDKEGSEEDVSTEEPVEEPVEEPTEEPVSVVTKITELAGIPKEDIVKEIEAVSEEEKEAINSSLCTLKEVFDELCPKNDENNDEITEEVIEDCDKSPIHEAEVASYKVVRVAPKVSAYMIEAQTKEGIKFITGKNFNEKDKTLEEAEISDSKLDATNRFKSLLENK